MVIGAAINEDRIGLYVCGGDDTFASHSRWYDGVINLTTGDFDLALNGWVVTANLASGNMQGTIVAPDQSELTFVAAPAGDGIVGVYDGEPNGCRIGVVVMGSDAAPTVQGVWCDDQNMFSQVTPMGPASLTEAGLLHVVTLDGQNEFFAEPVTP
jgi:hypothetical protein